MANRETFPSAPLAGDVQCTPGSTRVTVVGLQGVPVASDFPNDQDRFIYDATVGEWTSQQDPNIAYKLDDKPVSDDYMVLCDGVGFDVLLNWPYGHAFQVYLNGVGVA